VTRPELLAPAGDSNALEAAIRAGADAVYLGLRKFSARARAENFSESELGARMALLHRQGMRGYVALNTLVFDRELDQLLGAIRACADAGADAVMVQELGVARLVREVAPSLGLHLSTQATAVSPRDLELLAELGVRRVVLARELDLDAIARVRESSSLELEVFIHGALCFAYSGQCLASHAFGGRSANRGECAQPCRLGYALEVDGVELELPRGERVLSPRDLEAGERVRRLVEMGIDSLKIEGRLKSAAYVGATTRLYRALLDGHRSGQSPELGPLLRDARVAFSRDPGTGWLGGIDYLGWIEGHTLEHRGLRVGKVVAVHRGETKSWVVLQLEQAIGLGDGLCILGTPMLCGRVWGLRERNGRGWVRVSRADPRREISVWLGPEVDAMAATPAAPVCLTDDPHLEERLGQYQRRRVGLTLELGASEGELPELAGTSEDGRQARVRLDERLVPAPAQAEPGWLAEKLGRLGDTPFELRQLVANLPEKTSLPASALNRARRALTSALSDQAARRHASRTPDVAGLVEKASLPVPLPPGWMVLVRQLNQLWPVLEAGARGVYLELGSEQESRRAEQVCRGQGVLVGRAGPRVELTPRVASSSVGLECGDHALVRTRAGLRDHPASIADAPLHAANRLSAVELLKFGARAVTPVVELPAEEMEGLARSRLGPYLEIAVYQHVPLFVTRHCLYAAHLGRARDPGGCAQACRGRQLALVDRTGARHPVRTDAQCNNLVFDESPRVLDVSPTQLRDWGIRRLRVELLHESPEAVHALMARLLHGSE
jgi:putative protease